MRSFAWAAVDVEGGQVGPRPASRVLVFDQHRCWIFPRGDPHVAEKASRILDLYERVWDGQALEGVLSMELFRPLMPATDTGHCRGQPAGDRGGGSNLAWWPTASAPSPFLG